MAGRSGRSRRDAARGRRRGPAGEDPWWDPADQALAEAAHLVRADLGRGWIDVPMVNNLERIDPLGGDEASEAVRVERAARRLTALDEGRAWRQRTEASLAVLRVEVFADPDEQGHRAAWRAHAEESLDATWRERWRERGHTPGWVEARWVDAAGHPERFVDDDLRQELTPAALGAVLGAIDWLRIEDHTDPTGAGQVTVYEHLTAWAGRAHGTLTVRHDHAHQLDVVAGRATAALWRRLGGVT